ncbi:MAG: Hpt domain-containing protein [Gallionellaceae bacterium]
MSANLIPLLSAKTELEASLATVSRELESYFAAPKANFIALSDAMTELHRMQGVLQVLSLQGAVVFCREIFSVLQTVSALPEVPPALSNVLRKALQGLKQYLEAVASGGAISAMRLFPEYQELHQARGVESAFELDLFFPELKITLPPALLQAPTVEEPSSHIKAARMQYQQALLKWLRKDQPTQALQAMQGAMVTVSNCVPATTRDFWWVAQGFLDCLIHEEAPAELDVKKLLGQIDRQIKSLVDQSQLTQEPPLREMLYVVACSTSKSSSLAELKQRYTLDRHLSKAPVVAPNITAAVLGQMNALINVAELEWESCATGNPVACPRFFAQAQQIAKLSEQLDRGTLQLLCKQITQAAGQAVEPLDMALAILLLRGGIKHYQSLGENFHEQVTLLDVCMQANIAKTPIESSVISRLGTLYYEMKQEGVAAKVSAEMLLNLKHIEPSLTQFFSDTSKRAELAKIAHSLSQIQGGMHMLVLDMAGQVVVKLRQAIERYVKEQIPTPAEMRWAALSLSALVAYLQGIELGQQPSLAALQEVLQQSDEAWSEAADLVEEESKAGVSVRSGDESEELLEVFLEEAGEVMETLRSNLQSCQANADNREALTTIRRGFHTLKGSGRMVGLKDLGEVAWAVERAMNHWLQDEKPVTSALLEMVGDAEVLFQHWVEMLSTGNATATIDTAPLLAAASRIEHDGAELEVPVPEVIAPAVAERESPFEVAQEDDDKDIVIGTVSLSPVLFKIATEEAAGHVLALHKQWELLLASNPPVVAYDFMRSAHTLAGVNRTMGFLPIAELAYALELWLEERIGKAFVMDESQLALLEETLTCLDEMSVAVRARQAPVPQPELIAQLNATRELPPAPATKQVESNQIKQTVSSSPRLQEAVEDEEPNGVRDEVDEQLLPIFLDEANELYPLISENLHAWQVQDGADVKLGHSLQRNLHTLKGSARMAGAMRLGELTHQVEGRIDTAIAHNQFDTALWRELTEYLGAIARGIADLSGKSATKESSAEIAFAPASQAEPQTLEVGAERAMQAAVLRVRSDMVDRLVNEAGEVSVARSRVELELREFKSGILELTDSVHRLRQQLREIEIQAEGQIQARTISTGDSSAKFDPLEFDRFTRFQELTRFMNESVHDVQTIQQTLLKNISETEAALTAQGQINRELQQGLMAIRMVAFSSISDRLYRVVRQTAKELEKRVNLELSGGEVELDRSVLEKMTAPFEHLLRNAIAHGLEEPEQRERLNKAAIGEIHLSLRQESNEVVFELSDDGAGLNMARLKQKALEHGVLREGEEITEEQAIQMIFKPGLSTAQEITEISGRGVGLDVVRSEVSALGGRLDVASTAGKGVSFTIHLPLTLAITRTLMVRAGKDIYALPATMVEQVQQVKPQELDAIYAAHQIEWQGKSYPLHYLARLLGDEITEPVSRPYNALLLLHSGQNRIAVHVDELIGNQEVVVKNIGPQLARLPGIAGATVTGSGTVVLIINPIVFVQQIVVARKTEKKVAVAEPVHHVPLVMVVDDSLTVRKITSRLLLRAGYQVATAKDGEDALVQLADLSPAVMLLDVEMPRMDGFELAKRLRQDTKTKTLPIIMITSRTADKHRNYALEIGVNEYMGKPYQEDVLLESLARFAPLSE